MTVRDESLWQTYRIADLKHGSCGSSFISAHDILDDDVASLLLRSQDGPPHYRGELVFWEVLEEYELEKVIMLRMAMRHTWAA